MRIWIFTGITLFVAACQTTQQNYLYVLPMDQSAQGCVQACEDAQTSCIKTQDLAYQSCLSDRQFEQRVYRDCSQALNIPGTQGACRAPRPCPPPNTIKCVRDFNDCYTACGGSVVAE